MKVLIIYDSKTGNTQRMAEAIAEGINSVNGVFAEVKKIGQPWPLSLIADAEMVLFGSPVNYADVTDDLRSFIEHLKRYIKDGKIKMTNKRAAIFGSYGWDGAWIMEDRLKAMVSDLGFNLKDKALVKTDNEIRNQTAETLLQCREYGREIAESLRR